MIYKKSWKYILVKNDTKYPYFYRLKAIKNFSDVFKGDLGGYVQGYRNLSQKGKCWVYDNAGVFDDARITEDAWIFNNARVFDNAQVFGNAWVCKDAEVYENASVFGNARISNGALIRGYSQVYEKARVSGYTVVIEGDKVIKGKTCLSEV